MSGKALSQIAFNLYILNTSFAACASSIHLVDFRKNALPASARVFRYQRKSVVNNPRHFNNEALHKLWRNNYGNNSTPRHRQPNSVSKQQTERIKSLGHGRLVCARNSKSEKVEISTSHT